MACNDKELFKKIRNNVLDANAEVTIEAIDELESCRKLNTRYANITSGTGRYAQTHIPTNDFSCSGACDNTGTLYLEKGGASNIAANLQYLGNAIEIANGVITFYAKADSEVELKLLLSSTNSFSSGATDEYTVTVKGTGEYEPIVIDLTTAPKTATGWVPNETSVYIGIKTTSNAVGVSSFTIYDSIEALENTDVIKMSCLSSVGGDTTFELTNDDCMDNNYVNAATPRTISYTCKELTANYWKLDPTRKRGDATKGFEQTSKKYTIETVTVDGQEYGHIKLANVNTDICGLIYAQLDDCHVTDAQLNKLNVPVLVALEEKQYVAIKGENNTVDMYFSNFIAGNKVVVTYPELKEADEIVMEAKAIMGRRLRVVQKRQTSDGKKIVTIYNNAKVTSFPETITTEPQEFTLTVQAMKDESGIVAREFYINE